VLTFINDQEGWGLTMGESQCNDAGTIWHTTDGGSTWNNFPLVAPKQHTDSGIAYTQCKEHIYFIDSNHGFVPAWDDNHRPTIYRTSDGGKTWSGSTLPDPPDFKTSPGGFTLRAATFKRFGSTLYVEAYGPGRQYLFRSTDGGATWSWLTKVPSIYIAMVTESRWLQLVWPGQSMESTNSGQQWHPYESDFHTDTPVGGPQIVFADSQVGYAEGRGALQRTVDGGAHWERIATPGTYLSPTPPPVASSTRTSPSACGKELAGVWLTYTSAKWGYSVEYPANWCKVTDPGADGYVYFSNENAGSLIGMSPAGILVGLSVGPGACSASRGFKEIYEQVTLKAAGQEVTRTYGFFAPPQSEFAVMIQAAITHGSNCYAFNFITQTRSTGDKYLATADSMITSFRFN
jgi:photosystem II stability/assembly factor-like uncharacterized protein